MLEHAGARAASGRVPPGFRDAEIPPQAWVYFVTWVQYAANHVTRKCYTNVKNVMISLGLSKEVLGRMDAGFMFTSEKPRPAKATGAARRTGSSPPYADDVRTSE